MQWNMGRFSIGAKDLGKAQAEKWDTLRHAPLRSVICRNEPGNEADLSISLHCREGSTDYRIYPPG